MKRTLLKRRWSLYRRPRGAKKGSRWKRISFREGSKQRAIVIFQDRLLANSMGKLDPDFEYQLRWFIPEVAQ